jgi:hypothetical protein
MVASGNWVKNSRGEIVEEEGLDIVELWSGMRVSGMCVGRGVGVSDEDDDEEEKDLAGSRYPVKETGRVSRAPVVNAGLTDSRPRLLDE